MLLEREKLGLHAVEQRRDMGCCGCGELVVEWRDGTFTVARIGTKNIHRIERDIHCIQRDIHCIQRDIHRIERDMHCIERDIQKRPTRVAYGSPL